MRPLHPFVFVHGFGGMFRYVEIVVIGMDGLYYVVTGFAYELPFTGALPAIRMPRANP
jgi:hypothetical protein